MIRLRLFHRQDPARQIDSRVLDEGEISVGRGVKADWQVADPERDISRLHMTLTVRGGLLTVRDTSANGVYVGNPRTRLEADRAMPVSRGESLTFGPYLIVAEEDAGAVMPEAPILDDPFASQPFTGAREAEAPARPRDPFGSALRPDPVKLDEDPGDGVDAWERKREYEAGDWDPVAPHRRPDHSQLIGTPQGWAAPPAPPAREHGLGFDAPFTSPILREPEPTAADDIAIPSNWDEAVPATSPVPSKPPALADGFVERVDGSDPAHSDTPPIAAPPAPVAPLAETWPDAPIPLAADTAPAAPPTGFVRDPIMPSANSETIPPLLEDFLSPAAAAGIPIVTPAGEPVLPASSARDPILPPPTRDPIVPPAPATAPMPETRDDALLAAFCAGARLSPDAFAGEDRQALMERLGAVYRQAILGVADLMGERTALKNDFRMARTTIRPEGNNPFKWVPPQRIAVELLRSEDGSGYITGERALNEALHDVKAHMLCVLAGMRGAIGATFDVLSPDVIEARTANRGFVMPGQRNAAAWAEYVDQFATQRHEADDSVDGPINRAFRQSYEDQLRLIDAQTVAQQGKIR